MQASINLSVNTGSDLAEAAAMAGSASVRGFQLEAEEAAKSN